MALVRTIEVDANNHKVGSAPVEGTVAEELQTVTYVDENGNEIKNPTELKKNQPTDDSYDSTTEVVKPKVIEKDGKTYELVPAGEYTVGEVDKNGHLTTSAPVTGKVKEDPQTVTYVYREVKGDVIVHYVKQGVQMRGFRAT